jgi:hypothetical protein
MRTLATIVLLASTALTSTPSGASPESVLAGLAKTLQRARWLPRDVTQNLSCPGKLSEIVGLSKATILDALGNPDFQEGVISRDSDPFTLLHYDLSPGRTTVTFEVGSSNVVTSVSCT